MKINRFVQAKGWVWYWITAPFKGKRLSRPVPPWANFDDWITGDDMVNAIRQDDELGVKDTKTK